MSRRDDVSKLYIPPSYIQKACVGLFWGDIFLSVIVSFATGMVAHYLTTLLIIASISYTCLSIINDGHFWYKAESARRKNCIQNAFDVRLDEYETDGYYNNEYLNPELRYAVNLFESAFFTHKISERMRNRTILKLIIVIVVFVVVLRMISNDDVVLIVAQAVFSTFAIEDCFQMFFFASRIKSLYNEAYRLFVTMGVKMNEKEHVALIRYFCVEYEAIKAHYKIRLNKKIFDESNSELSDEWQTILQKIRVTVD